MQIERKVPIVLRPTHTIYLERTDGMTFGHCDLHVPYSRHMRKVLAEDWAAIRRLHEPEIRALHTPGDRKHLTFLRIFGFVYERSYEDPSGAIIDIFINS